MLKLCDAPWHENPLFPPYQFFDIQHGREEKSSNNSTFNTEEAVLSSKLIELLCSSFPDKSFFGKIGGKLLLFY